MISFNLSKLECYDANHHEKNHSIDNLYSKTRCYRCQLRCFFFLGKKETIHFSGAKCILIPTR